MFPIGRASGGNLISSTATPVRSALRGLLILAASSASFLMLSSPAGAAVQVPAGFTDQTLVGGLDAPTGFAFLPDGRVLVVEQTTGKVRLVVGNHIAATDPVFTRTGLSSGNERGLLGIAVDPRWPTVPWVYLIDTRSTGNEEVIRYVASGDLSNASGENLAFSNGLPLIDDIPDTTPFHNAGCLRFGADGCLYVSLGDDESYCDAADSTTLRGTILRLRVTTLPSTGGSQVARSVITPPDNPFVSSTDANARLEYANGFRNPFRFQIDPVTDTLIVGDVGDNTREEMDRVGIGDFMGWPWREGTLVRTRTDCPEPGGAGTFPYVPPIWEVPHDQAVSYAIISGGIYRPVSGASNNWPAAYHGDIFFGQYYQGYLRRLKKTGSSWSLAAPVAGQADSADWAIGLIASTDFQVGPDGSLWWLAQFDPAFDAQSGSLHKIISTASTAVGGGTSTATWMMRASPNPSAGSTELRLSAPRDGHVDLAIYDLDGRRVRVIFAGTLASGERRFAWDGADDRGRAVRPGVYFARLRTDDVNAAVTTRILRVQ